MPRAPLSCAIVGLGRIGSTLEDDPLREKPASHAGAIAALPELCRLAGGADPDPDRRAAFRSRWGSDAVFPDTRSLLAAVRPEILHVAVPPAAHEAVVLEAAAAAVPVIICEKPLAPDSAAGMRMVEACARAKVHLLVNHERRYAADYLLVRDWLRNARSASARGAVRSVHARVFMGERRTPQAMLFDDGTHMLDILRFLLEEDPVLKHVQGDPEEPGGSLIVLLAAGAVPVVLEVGAGREQVEFELDISCARGRLRIGNGILEAFTSRPSPWYSGMFSLAPDPVPAIADKGYFTGMLRDAAALARGERERPRSSGEDALVVLRLMEQIIAAG